MPLVQWEDDDGNLYEAAIHESGGDWQGYVKQWSAEGKLSTVRGMHRILWQGGGSAVQIWRFRETVRLMAERYGCPPEKSGRLLDIKW
jgi:hypothetical protein